MYTLTENQDKMLFTHSCVGKHKKKIYDYAVYYLVRLYKTLIYMLMDIDILVFNHLNNICP